MSKKFLFLSAALLAVILLSACSGAPVSGNTWPGLAASDEAAYLANGTFVYAVSLQNGTELWHYPAERDSKLLFFATPYMTEDGLVIVGSSGSNYSLVALDPSDIDSETKSPREAWNFTGAQDTWVAAPLAIDDRLFAPNSDGNLYVFDLSDGQTDKQPIEVVELEGDLWSQPVTDGQSIFLSSLEHTVYAVDKDTYDVIWQEDLGSAITSPPILASDGNLYVGSFASRLEKFDPASGNHQSVGETKDWVWGTPGSIEDNLYFGDLSGNFYSYNLEQAAYDWESVIPGDESIKAITASPLALNEILLVATEAGVVYEVDHDGDSRLWTQPGGKIYTTPLTAGDLVLVSPMNTDAILYAYDLNGRQAWAFKPEN